MRSSVIHKAQRERTHQGVHDEWSLRSECRLTSAGWFYTPSPGDDPGRRAEGRSAGRHRLDRPHPPRDGLERLPYPPRDGAGRSSHPTEGRAGRGSLTHRGTHWTRLGPPPILPACPTPTADELLEKMMLIDGNR